MKSDTSVTRGADETKAFGCYSGADITLMETLKIFLLINGMAFMAAIWVGVDFFDSAEAADIGKVLKSGRTEMRVGVVTDLYLSIQKNSGLLNMVGIDSPKAPTSKSDNGEIIRWSADYHPSVWGDHFLASSPTDLKPNVDVQQRIDELKKEVNKMLRLASNKPSKEINLIDTLQRLGIAYHFQEEIGEALERIYDVQIDANGDDNLYTVALRFRLLRQQGYNVSADVFSKFKHKTGSFKEHLISDLQGMLSLYEASHLSVRGEDILDEALAFTSTHLKTMMNHLTSSFASQIGHALELPLHKRVPRLENRHYISIYQEEKTRNEVLLELAKLDFNQLQLLHQREIHELSRWWKDIDIASKLPFSRDRLVECCFWGIGVYFEPQYAFGRILMAKLVSIVSIIDDIYDVYGTLEELQLFTNAIEGCDQGTMDQLPEYMKVCIRELENIFNQTEEEMIREEKLYSLYYLKQEMKALVGAYFAEAQWFYTGYVPKLEEYLQISLITSVYPLITVIQFIGMGEIATKEAFDWTTSMPKLIRSSSMVGRLMDDIKTHKVEQKRGHVASSVQCYMKEHEVLEEEACEKLQKMVEGAWKDINSECLAPTPIPFPLLLPIVNLARIIEVIYMYGDGYTDSSGRTKENIASLLVDCFVA
ncbi:hypothetical protein HHK36_004906 [Tetracentron sinense]|uniref:Uncharacterized protein n=1 Tax=Tetracentron sinense TaxID=13715 RepID=A0A834ZM57_TETSI|nr:hypothetical protein HHK36_004906 [Tetracentron sinense]